MYKQLCCVFLCLSLQVEVASAKPASPSKEPSQAIEARQVKPSPTNLSKQALAKLQQDIYNYEKAISEIESQHGAYGMGMNQQLDSLGVAYQTLGKHVQAVDVFTRAIHLTRIHEGLYSHNQLPMIQRQINSLMHLGKWDEVSNKYQYMYWLNKISYDENDPRMLDTLGRMSKWHLQAYAMKFGNDQAALYTHLIKAHNMLERSVTLIEQSDGDQTRLIESLNGLTLTSYLFATLQRHPNIKPATRTPLDNDVRSAQTMIDIYVNRSFRSGRDAIGRVINIYENSDNPPRHSVAKAKVKLGDWLFLFNKQDAALEVYAEAYAMLKQEDPAHQELKKVFDKPVALPNEDLLETNNYYSMEENKYDTSNHYVIASFDVTKQGKAANIEIIDSMPKDNVTARSVVKRTLRIAKFRPRFVEGEPALTENMQLRILSR